MKSPLNYTVCRLPRDIVGMINHLKHGAALYPK